MPRTDRPLGYAEQVGRRLRAARGELGREAAEICRAINVQQNTYSQWESGKYLIPPHAARRLKDRYGISLDWLYAGDASGMPRSFSEKAIRAGE